MKAPKFNVEQMKAIVAEADKAGDAAAQAAVDKMSLYAIKDGFSGKIVDFMRGSCGFAWVIVKPGNSRFAKYLKEKKLARPDSYYGGVNLWVSAYGQSMEMKEAYAHAYANVLQKHGINAYSGSRMD